MKLYFKKTLYTLLGLIISINVAVSSTNKVILPVFQKPRFDLTSETYRDHILNKIKSESNDNSFYNYDQYIIEGINLKDSVLDKKENVDYTGNHFMLGLGYGLSYGRIGIRAQWRRGKTQGIGLHLGAGYYIADKIHKSMGIKFFPYKNLYLNAQIGNTGNTLSYDDNNRRIVKLISGITYMIGGDWVWGKDIAFGFNLAAGVSNNIFGLHGSSFKDVIPKFQPALDVGFIVRY